jgi:hypothetical protein
MKKFHATLLVLFAIAVPVAIGFIPFPLIWLPVALAGVVANGCVLVWIAKRLKRKDG